ncbi:hypothetical protein LAU_0093 [Lausannevirus]|uniref:F-box domain-containing protein n=2 Tax=Lausannevirus TaxID=999883 RepID=A0A0N9PHN4_9VIRU|nr:hypothetical protein LAU_0093 [Lausannevirus]AEA06946.1 hypothetical protein LAU_0093 [Lausannevirus]ALH06781.1 hypothetical protein PMV_083 [Port-miou virus]
MVSKYKRFAYLFVKRYRMNIEELPQELLVRIYEHSSGFPKDHKNWCLVSRLFYGIAKRNSYKNLTRFCFHLSKRNKKIKRQKDEQLDKFIKEKKDAANRLQKKTVQLLDLQRISKANENEIFQLKRISENSGGYQKLGFNYY